MPVGPTLMGGNNPSQICLGTPLTLVVIIGSGGQPPYTIKWNWGDGTPVQQVPAGPVGPGQFQNTHNYVRPGAYNYQVVVSGTDGGQSTLNGVINVIVCGGGGGSGGGNVPPPTPPNPTPQVNPPTIPGGNSAPGITVPNPSVVNPPLNINAPSNPPNIPIVFGRNTTQTGPSNNKTSITCGIANAKLIMKKASKGTMPANSQYGFSSEPVGGFFSVLPVSGPDNINNQLPVSGGYGPGFFLTDQNNNPRKMNTILPANMLLNNIAPGSSAAQNGAASMITEPLFNGVLHILLVNFNNGGNNQIGGGDLQTIINYINAIVSIQVQYCNQWGLCGMTVDSTIYNVTLNISGTTFNDGALAGTYGSTPGAGFIDTVAQSLGFTSGGPSAHAFIVICPVGITNTDCDPSKGYLGYHSASAVNNIPYIYVPMTTTGLTSNDSADVYQIAVSHEIAELLVDPSADLNNPEVCDSCGPNCQSVIRNFFDSNGNYLLSSAIFIGGSPGFTYATMTNAVSAPPYATTAGNTCPMVPYNYCAYAPNGAQSQPNPITGFSALESIFNQFINEGLINLSFPNGATCQGQLVQLPTGAIILQLPLGGPH